ncbi:MAG: DUF3307 domain-containing protein [Rhodospirillales bacterium]|nr:DUF3307 domain-containing protein [Rhodospirillales bacterium]MCB9972933.1 DUF3307 domain-containing protein [Rhodospirillales bacterium]MCB9980129.1 DUF3307 domain-containing protein [Rhodospirillales bacterium]
MELFDILILYTAFRLKHFACDFLLQTDWMALTKGKPGREGYKALVTHTGIHAMGTLIVTLLLAPGYWFLAGVDFLVHSIIDRAKGLMTYENKWTPKDTIFWWTFGLDQEAHNFTHLAYIIVIVMGYSLT